jgi:WD40 repeat protein
MSNEELALNNEKRQRVIRITVRFIVVFFLLYSICLNAAAQDVAVFPQLGHTGSVYSVAFSPDGKQLVSGSHDKTIKLWDVTTGREIKTFSGLPPSTIITVCFSPDGKQILSGSFDGIKLWDVATGREIRTFTGHNNPVYSIAFSPDGRQVLSSSYNDGWQPSLDHVTKVWDIATGREIRTFKGHNDYLCSVAFSSDGKFLVSGSHDKTIKLWDIATGREIKTFLGHTDIVKSVAFSPDGRQIVSGSSDKTIRLWDVATGREIKNFLTKNEYAANYVSFSPNGKLILSGSKGAGFTIQVWDIATNREIWNSGERYRNIVESITFNSDGKQILSGYGDGTIKIWDITTGLDIITISGYTMGVKSASFFNDGKQIVNNSNRQIRFWDVTTGRENKVFPDDTNIINLSPDGKQVLAGNSGTFGYNAFRLWDVANVQSIKTFQGYTDGLFALCFSPDGRQALSGHHGGPVRLWDVGNGNVIKTFMGLEDYSASSVKFSPNGKYVLTGAIYSRLFSGEYGLIKLWDAATGREIHTILDQRLSGTESVAFSPDGTKIVSGAEKILKLWDTATGREVRTFFGLSSDMISVTFSSDGKQIASGLYDGTINLWYTDTGREIRTFLGHKSWINSIIFSSDGRQLLSGSNDGTTRLWDISTGKEIAQFISFIDGEWLVLAPDGYYNASPNGDKYLNVRVGNNVYGIDQYRNTFYRPQIVEARLQGRPDPVRVATTIQDAANFEPPVVVFRSPENGATLSSNQVELSISVVDQRQPIKTIKVLVNGRLVGGETMRGRINSIRGELELETTQIRLNGNQKIVEFKLPVTLDPGVNRIEVRASNPYSERPYSIEVTNRQAATQNTLPNLYILSIGVNRYDDTRRLETLKYAVNDAKAIIDAFKAQEGKRYGRVIPLLIADGEKITPTKENIVDNFNHLRQAGPQDVVMLFIAGHGLNDQYKEFYFMPSDAAFNANGSIRPSRAISSREIQAVLSMPGQKLVFIDACHSAGTSGGLTQRVNNDRLINDLNNDSAIRASSVIFTSSKGDQSSLEMDQYKHGVFTYAILQGLKGEADLLKKGIITTTALYVYIREKVIELTKSLQEPRSFRADGLDEFEMVILK